jgi:hypothetical protein
MEQDKRKGDEPVPQNATSLLNDLQTLALHQIEGFGWQLQFIRRPMFEDPVPVVIHSDGKQIGVLEQDGRINMEPDIKVRG